jgi:hypothetical protein
MKTKTELNSKMIDEIEKVVFDYLENKLYGIVVDLDSNEFRDEIRDRLFDKNILDGRDYDYKNEVPINLPFGSDGYVKLVSDMTSYLLHKFQKP